MKRKLEIVSRLKAGSAIVTLCTLCHAVLFGQTGNLEGLVRDGQTKEPLPSANVVVAGTSIGISTDFHGRYVLRNVPPGSYTLRVAYIGYQTVEVEVQVVENETAKYDFALEPVAIEGAVVVVTAQAAGQNEAINRQLASTQIVNVVSSARIQELPDANAAEAVGRLPGVSVLRSGGEGTQVVIRGLQPKYNAIMVDGVRMASSNAADRSSDLSMISPYMLEAIEVTKAVTPDQDPDVLGGTVNFKIREAKEGKEGFGFNLLAQGAYTGLANARNKYKNYKYIAGGEGRFLDNSFGVFAQADLERRNLSSNEMGASYGPYTDDISQYLTNSINLNDLARDRVRANGTAVMDYTFSEGRISLTNLLSSGTTEVQNRGETFNIPGNSHSYSLAYSKNTLTMITNALNAEYELPMIHAVTKLSHSYSETKSPHDWIVTFVQPSGGGLGQFSNQPNIDPQAVPKAANNDFSQTILSYLTNLNSFSYERAFTAGLDLDTRSQLFDGITTVIKLGGKYRYQSRSYTFEQFGNNASFSSPSARVAASLIASHFPSTAGYDPNALPITAFIDGSFDYGSFLNGDYTMVAPLDFGTMAEMASLLQWNASYINQQQPEGYARNNLLSTTNNYWGNEVQSAAYAMTTVNFGEEITTVVGVRRQALQTSYTAAQGNESSLSYYEYRHYDSTVTVDHAYWLPCVILRYKPLTWFDLRLSYTNTLAYPDYNAIVPRINVSSSGVIQWNNSQLSPSSSRNYDAYCSFYDNSIGLFTVGAFLKQIDNLIYPWDFYVTGQSAVPYFPPGFSDSTSFTYHVFTHVNNPHRVDLWGLEFDWQTHFWYLPGPFEGLVLNVNYTHTYSKAEYPYTLLVKPGPRLPPVQVDTSATDRILHQPNNIVNLSLGYDLGGFSIRLSMLYHADIFSGPNFWPQLRTTTAAYKRWDLSIKQDLPWFGLQLYGDVNNINAAQDVNIIRAPTGVPRSRQSYGLYADLGIRWQF